jgi:hypothetical protein
VLDRDDVLPPARRADIQQRAIESLAQRDPQAAYVRATRLPKGLNRVLAIESTVSSFAHRDPDAALAWARSLAPQPPGVLTMLASAIADTDALRARDLALQIENPVEQMQALRSVVEIWALRDPVSAQAWVLSQSAGMARDRALSALVGIAAQSGTPDDALLAGFSEERARLSAITSTGTTIARRAQSDRLSRRGRALSLARSMRKR